MAGRSARVQTQDNPRGVVDAPAIQSIQRRLHLHQRALEGRLADALEIIDPAVMVIIQPAIVIRVDGLDVMRIDSYLQFVVGVKIPTGLVVHQDNSIPILQHQVNHTHHRRQVIRQQDGEWMFDCQARVPPASDAAGASSKRWRGGFDHNFRQTLPAVPAIPPKRSLRHPCRPDNFAQ